MPERAHRGRRQDRTSKLRLSRQEREDGLLDLLGAFRVAARRSIVNAVFDGHPFAANRTLASLERRGLIDKKTVPRCQRALRNAPFRTGHRPQHVGGHVCCAVGRGQSGERARSRRQGRQPREAGAERSDAP